MTLLQILYIIWTALAMLFLSLLLYRSTLTRYEDEKLFLDGHDEYGEKVQSEIIRKVNRMNPFVRFVGMATGIMSASIVGIFLYRAILVLQS